MSISFPSFSTFPESLNVLIVGVSGGIGCALAEHCLNSPQVKSVYGWSRASCTIDNEKFRHTAIDYADENSIKLAASHIIEPLDIVVVATGFLHDDSTRPEKTFKQLNNDSFQKNFLVNTIGPSLVAKHILPMMRSETKSLLGILSARVGSISDNRLGGWHAYRAAKAAVNMVIKNLSIELSRKQPKTIVVGLHPGTVNTSLSEPFQRNVTPGKLFTAEYSAECLLNVINQLEIDNSGDCFAWDGQQVPA